MDGSFVIKGLPRGRYVVKVEFMGFATNTQDVVLNPENPAGKVEPVLELASRQQEEQQASRANTATAASRGFQSLSVEGNGAGLTDFANGNNGGTNNTVSASDLSSLPNSGAGADLATESFAVAGTQGRSQDFGMGNEEELQQRVQEFQQRAIQAGGVTQYGQMVGQGGGFGGPGGPGSFGGGGGPIMIQRFGGRGFNLNQPHGFLYFQDDNDALDARSYWKPAQNSRPV
jgi:hypothetical protein